MHTFAAHVHLVDVRTGRATTTMVVPVRAVSADAARAKARAAARMIKRPGQVIDDIDVYP